MADANNKPQANPPVAVDPVQAELEALRAEIAALKAPPPAPKQAGTPATTTVRGGKYKVGDVYRDANGKVLEAAKDED